LASAETKNISGKWTADPQSGRTGVELQPGYTFGPKATGPLVAPSSTRGMHGFLPERREMNSSFFIAGPGIEPGKALGEFDMRDIAPTLAAILGIKLGAAEGRDLFAAGSR
jgi:predicted AlkP superfamily pyrophosphatase or phosphodiesterase